VRLLLDAHVSGRRIGARLGELGHDVRAVDEDRSLDGCPDEDLLKLATDEGRVLVTLDAADFPRIAREWAGAGRAHAGCAVLMRFRHHEFGAIIRAIEVALDARPDRSDWDDRVVFVSR
jgi:hypothetical protein